MGNPSRLGEHVAVEIREQIAILSLDRPEKRNALDGGTVRALGSFFEAPPPGIAAAVLTSSSDHFSAGLDLSELTTTTVFEGVLHSRGWHEQFDKIQFGTVPVVSVLRGAVIGGGLELAISTHVRVAEASAYYALPEGSRGIFVGGGGSMRLPRLIGVHRMADMMLTGRVIDAKAGLDLGISQYLVDDGEGLATAIGLAERISQNSPITNYAVLQALPRIAEMGPQEGLFVESLVAAISQGSDEAKSLLEEFLAGRAAKVVANEGAP
ncbi:MAG: enoyl-CoA hydratase [Acidimicrobiaceae bacterium]|nr:enoyl-CoA hydratase [Acidimicrobiaceae bacterium]